MRKYEILNREGKKIAEYELDDSQAPALITGFTARVVEVNGKRTVEADGTTPDAKPDTKPEAATAEAEKPKDE